MADRRYGQPRTEEERKARHLALHGTESLPPRGTGLSSNPGSNPGTNWLGWGLIALLLYLVLRRRRG